MRRAAILVLLLVLAMAGCGADRPEGVAERWLVSLNQGPAGEPERFAEDAPTSEIAPSRATHGIFEVIEVGRGLETASRARVPFRVVTAEGSEIRGTIELERVSGAWRVVDLGLPEPALAVPSRGGERIGRASIQIWIVSALLGMLLTAVSAVLMKVAGGKPSRPLEA